MKFLPLLLLFNLSLCAQNHPAKQNLYYFISKDGLLGVKNGSGKIIIPAVNYNSGNYKNHELVSKGLVYLTPVKNTNAEPHSMGMAYDRTGKLLFAPFNFDNGPDYISEGMQRFVKNKKIGFADRSGRIIIDAKFDYAESFNYGIASFCNGCMWIYKGEHARVTGGIWGYINRKGVELTVNNHRTTIKDQRVDSTHYIPYQFSYNAFEKKIIDSFYKLPIISKIHFVNYYDSLDNNEKTLHYEIVEKPSPPAPYYHVKAFEYSNNRGYHGDEIMETNFFVTKDGKTYLAADDENKIPLKKWIHKNTTEAKEYLKTHPRALNKF